MPYVHCFQPEAQLPVINLQKLCDRDAEECRMLQQVCSKTGIFHLELGNNSDFGPLWDELLQFSQTYFMQDLETKLKDRRGEVYGKTLQAAGTETISGTDWKKGYEPVGTSEGLSSGFSNGYEALKFARDSTMSSENALRGDVIENGRGVVQIFQQKSHCALMQILTCLESDEVSRMHSSDRPSRTNSVLLRYPSDAPLKASGHNEHKDMGTLTLLLTQQWGLQILDLVDHTWKYVPPSPKLATVNVGESLHFISQGKYTPALHRVEQIKDETQEDKYSFAFFLRPADDAEYRGSDGSLMTAAAWHNLRTERKVAGSLREAAVRA